MSRAFPAAEHGGQREWIGFLFFIFFSCYNRAREVPGFLMQQETAWSHPISGTMQLATSWSHIELAGWGYAQKANKRARKSFARRRPSSISGVMTERPCPI